MPDVYLVSMQLDILAVIQRAKYIFTVNCSVYFYQWWINLKHQHHLIIFSHQEQKIFKIVIMNYCNSSVYVQWIIDRILWSHYVYLCIYVNDIVIYSTTLSKHLHHLQYVFNEFIFKEIYLFSEKFFLNYSSIQLLKQQVNALKLVTVKDKLVVITNLEFLCTLTQLKKYLDLIDYLWQYISHYTVIVKSLQLCKTLLNQ